jgi:CHAD domain-containing protein
MDRVMNEVVLVPAGIPAANVATVLAKDLGCQSRGTVPESWRVMDTPDQRLRRAGLLLFEWEDRLSLHRDDEQGQRQALASASPRPAVRAEPRRWPASSLKDLVLPHAKVRAFVPMADITLQRHQLAVVDTEEKTVARVEIVEGAAGDQRLTWLQVDGLRGYDREYEQVVALVHARRWPSLSTNPLIRLIDAHRPPKPGGLPRFSDGGVAALTAVSELTTATVTHVRGLDSGIVDDVDSDFLHQYRVGLRKVRSLLSLLKSSYSPERASILKAGFGRLASATNELRDLDVYLLARESLMGAVPPMLSNGASQLFDEFERRRKRVQKQVATWLQSDAYRRQVHDLRLECKKLRYLLDFFGHLINPETGTELIKPLKKLQDRLGAFNDCAVQSEFLLAYARDAARRGQAGKEIALAVGALVGDLHQRMLQHRSQTTVRFSAFDVDLVRNRFRESFRITPEGGQ